MVTLQFRQAITKVLDILEHIDKSYTDKIPEKFKNFLKENRLATYEPKLDHSKKLNQMKLNKDTKNILGIIYSKYWCDKSQRTEFMTKIKLNEIVYQKELRKKYNSDKIFKKKHIQYT